MEILFRSRNKIFGIKDDNKLGWYYIGTSNGMVNVKYLDDVEPLYNYKDVDDGELLPVYYEHNNKFITNYKSHYIILDTDNYTKDYTSTNLNLL